jgi:hypothetical protein
MNNKIKFVAIISSIIIITLYASCNLNKLSQFDFLVGQWKHEHKDQFEVWTKDKNNELVEYGYLLRDDKQSITETLSIKKLNNKIIYEATVSDQNEGKSVPFILNTKIATSFSFENNNHDFPKKIQYEKLSRQKIKVNVLGDDNEGFSFVMIKQ